MSSSWPLPVEDDRRSLLPDSVKCISDGHTSDVLVIMVSFCHFYGVYLAT